MLHYKHFTPMTSFNGVTALGGHYWPPLADGETEAPGGRVPGVLVNVDHGSFGWGGRVNTLICSVF